MIPYSRHTIKKDDVSEVVKVLKSNFLTQGPLTSNFENTIKNYAGANYAVSANSATSALHIACLALDLTKDDIVWTVPNSFVASANCALYCGSKIDFVDINTNTYNIDCDLLEEKLIKAKKLNSLPKVIIPVHFAGQPTEQEKIWKLSKRYGFKIIEDASHSLGAHRNGEKVGSCKWSDICVFSFHAIKIITTGEGGIALTNSKKISKKMRIFSSHGIVKPLLGGSKKKFKYYYDQKLLGLNYRMNEIEAALGISQLKRIDQIVKKRNIMAKRYNKLFEDTHIKIPTILKENLSTFHLYQVHFHPLLNRSKFNYFFEYMYKRKIYTTIHYQPIHLLSYYKKLGFKKGMFPNAEQHSNSCFAVPLYDSLKISEQKKIVKTIKNFFINI